MTHAQELEAKYFALYRQMADIKAYLLCGGTDIERIRQYANGEDAFFEAAAIIAHR